MVRKAPATTKHKGSQKNETYMPGITESSDFIQQYGDSEGLKLDQSVAENAAENNVPAPAKDR